LVWFGVKFYEKPHIPCRKGLSGRGRGVTDKKVKFYPTNQLTGLRIHADEPEPRTDVARLACSFCAIGADG
jgi:hypothetical protein